MSHVDVSKAAAIKYYADQHRLRRISDQEYRSNYFYLLAQPFLWDREGFDHNEESNRLHHLMVDGIISADEYARQTGMLYNPQKASQRKELHIPSLCIGIAAFIIAFVPFPVVNSIEMPGWLALTACAFVLSISGMVFSVKASSNHKSTAAFVLSLLSLFILLFSVFLLLISLGGDPPPGA